MEEPAYKTIKNLFHRDNLTEFCEHYARLLPTEVLQDAAIFSMHHRIEYATKRAILELSIDYIDPLMLVVIADGHLNFGREPRPLDSLLQMWFKAEAGFGAISDHLNCAGEDDSVLPLPESRQALLAKIATCEYQEFQSIIRSLRIHDDITEYLDYPVVIALIERFDRILKNDQMLYLILLSCAIAPVVQENMPPETETIVIAVDAEALANGEIDMDDIMDYLNEIDEDAPPGASIRDMLEGIANTNIDVSSPPVTTSTPMSPISMSTRTPDSVKQPYPQSEYGPSFSAFDHAHRQYQSHADRKRRRDRYRTYWHLDD